MIYCAERGNDTNIFYAGINKDCVYNSRTSLLLKCPTKYIMNINIHRWTAPFHEIAFAHQVLQLKYIFAEVDYTHYLNTI